MNIKVYYEIRVWDATGRVIARQRRRRSRSFVKQYLELLLAQMRGFTVTSVKDTGGTLRNVSRTYNIFINGPINNDSYGIVIGTGVTAVAIGDFQLASQIAHGVGAGQMVHQAQAIDAAVTVAAPSATFVTDRNFNNNSGAQITVGEIGVYAQAYAATFYFCIVRDVPTSLAVPDGGGCYVKYTFKITV